LLILDGERLSYRTLDVEQIGSVYEAIMGFELQVSAGKSIAIKPVKSHGAPATINLEALLAAKAPDRAKLLNEWTDQKLGAGDAAALKDATSIDDLVAALDKKIAKHVTPGIVPADSMVFQPSDERRRSGSHYTPRSLTQPIVRTTLEPILKQMVDPEAPLPKVYEPTREDKLRYTAGELEARVRLSKKHIAATEAARAVGCAHPSQILELKVCDPAMGSGAFLVETCRQLGDELIKAWAAHDMIPADIPPDEDEVLYARRTVAQRCLYGVDKNIMAVDLAKLSLWLVTLAKDHPFTFLDHSLRHGDSLVGLTREQIIGFHWEPKKQKKFGEDLIQKRLDRATEARAKILSAREDVAYRDQEQRLAVAEESLNVVRMVADACVSAFFSSVRMKEREEQCDKLFGYASQHFQNMKDGKTSPETRDPLTEATRMLRSGNQPVVPFHWEIEFPEVFLRSKPGFDLMVGNPPFLGGARISAVSGMKYFQYLTELYPPAGHQCDLVGYFFRRVFDCLRVYGTAGLLATKTVCQGDTRRGGLAQICKQGGEIYFAESRFVWPGQASVILSRVHFKKGTCSEMRLLDGRQVDRITSYLFHAGGDDDPHALIGRNAFFSKGCLIYGQGFLFDDGDPEASSLEEMRTLLRAKPEYTERIKPYLGGYDINQSPTHQSPRFAINMSDVKTEEELRDFPEIEAILRSKVLPYRNSLGSNPNNNVLKRKWWAYQAHRPELYQAIEYFKDVLVIAQVSKTCAFTFVSPDQVFNAKVFVFTYQERSVFAVLQSRVHEVWARFFSSSLKDDLQYTPTACFETFVYPTELLTSEALESVGTEYFDFRKELMLREQLGLTDIYNCFHDPLNESRDILRLRKQHSEMDEMVLRAYGWNDLANRATQPNFCQFLLDYEDEEEVMFDGSVARQKKKPWRYRWPDDFRDEVLARLLELNEQRHKEELLLVKSKPTELRPAKQPTNKPAKAMPLFDGFDEVELDPDERLILLIVDSFKLITRTAVDEAFIAMKYPKLRKSRLGLGTPPKSVPPTDAGRDALIGGLVDRGLLIKHPSDHQQIWKLGAYAPSLAPTKAERQALDETQAIFQKSIDANDNLASCKEGVTDAKPGLVSNA
jgi:hypothetical protein